MKTILFDLDATLLPMDQDRFTMLFFTSLSEFYQKNNKDRPRFQEAFTKGLEGMVSNNGTQTNEEKFWEVYEKFFPDYTEGDKVFTKEYYKKEFVKAKLACDPNPEIPGVIRTLKQQGYRLVLATNPVFPLIAQKKRVEWAGLEANDFEYISSYENSSYCKPNPKYYEEIVQKLDLRVEDCVMVGNDATEDMVAETLGIKVFLLTDGLINTNQIDITGFPKGSFKQLLQFLKELE